MAKKGSSVLSRTKAAPQGTEIAPA